MTVSEAVTLIGALAILIGALSTYRSAMRKADIDALQRRMGEAEKRQVEAEKRQAQADERAATYEHRANEYRTDVIQLGEELAKERCENKKRLEELKQASEHQIDDLKRQSQITINKLVVIIESMWKQLKAAGLEPDFDLEDLKKMYVVEKAEEVA